MDPALLEIPFDHFQRYSTAAGILSALGLEQGRVLEVGANRQRLLGRFLPGAKMLYTDLQSQGGAEDFVVADATRMPFEDNAFDAVVSLDMLEHVPGELRATAVAEMARVARLAVVIGCPVDAPWVRAAEESANGFWHRLFGHDYPWLAEHKEFGLVDAGAVVQEFEQAGMTVERIGHGDPILWSDLMTLHFAKVKFPEMEPLVATMDRLYNTRISGADVGHRSYREYFVAIAPGQDRGSLRKITREDAARDDETRPVLAQTAAVVRSVASRMLRAETGWTEAVKAADERTVDLAEAKAQWKASAQLVEQVEADLTIASAQWKASAAAVHAVEADLITAKSQWEASVQAVRDAQADLEVAKSEWRATADLLEAQSAATEEAREALKRQEQKLAEALADAASLETELQSRGEDLEVAKREWSATATLLRARESDLVDSERRFAELKDDAERREQRSRQQLTRATWIAWLAGAIAFVLGVIVSRSFF